jgi:hypothetical protein
MTCPYCLASIAPDLAKCPSCGFTLGGSTLPRGQPAGGVAPFEDPMTRLMAPPRRSNLAMASLVLGIGSWVALGPLASIPAIITGHMARKEIEASDGTVEGAGLATGGLVLGYANLVAVLVFLLFIAGFIGWIFTRAQ